MIGWWRRFFVSRGVPLAITLQRAGLSGVTGTDHENPVGGLDVQAMKLVKFGLSFHLAMPIVFCGLGNVLAREAI